MLKYSVTVVLNLDVALISFTVDTYRLHRLSYVSGRGDDLICVFTQIQTL